MNSIGSAGPACGLDATVVGRTPICREHSSIECVLTGFPRSEPGQFVQLLCRDHEDSGLAGERLRAEDRCHSWRDGEFPALSDPDLRGPQAYLRRPFSIADHWSASDGRAHLLVIARTVGPGTAWLEQLGCGDTLNVTGPLGRGFRIPAPDVPCVLVGGGVGVPPLLYLLRRLSDRGQRDVVLILGTRNREFLPVRLIGRPATDGRPTPCVAFPSGGTVATVVTSDDGSVGVAGTVIAGLECWLTGRRDPGGALVLACGPEGMLRAVAAWTRRHGLACQLCIERNMGCGLGTCQSCVVRVCAPELPNGWRWALSCQEGPVFDREELLDYASGGRT